MLLAPLSVLVCALVTPPWFEKNMLPPKQAAAAVQTITEMPTVVVVDANNARGAVAFRFSKLEFTDLVAKWAKRNGLADRVVICWDHGLLKSTCYREGILHTFAGPRMSADDAIAETVVPRLYAAGEDERVYVVTTDRGLIHRVKHAAASSGAKHGKLRLLGTRKFASLLLHAAQRDDEESRGDRALADSFERGDASVRKFAASQRKKRRHEGKRRAARYARSGGFSNAFAEKTWHRVVLAEKLRRLLAEDTVEAGNDAPKSSKAITIRALAGAFEPSTAAGTTETTEVEPPAASGLLNDCRLDGKQRALILRFGGALSNGLLRPKAPETAVADGSDADPTRGGGYSGSYRLPPTRRQRRERRRESAAKAGLADSGTGGRRRSNKELAALEQAAQLEGLERWLFGDDALWAPEAECGEEDEEAEPAVATVSA